MPKINQKSKLIFYCPNIYTINNTKMNKTYICRLLTFVFIILIIISQKFSFWIWNRTTSKNTKNILVFRIYSKLINQKYYSVVWVGSSWKYESCLACSEVILLFGSINNSFCSLNINTFKKYIIIITYIENLTLQI